MAAPLGATLLPDGVRFSVWSSAARSIQVCVFDPSGQSEVSRHELQRGEGDTFSAVIPGLAEGARYGFRADGDDDPARGLWFDPAKLLVDPYAVEIDRPYVYDLRLGAPRGEGVDTAALMPKAIVRAMLPPVTDRSVRFEPGGLIYEIPVRGFTKRHPDIPEPLQGTIAALRHPSVVAYLKNLCVSAVELMPVTAWIDERHLPPLGLANAWGYNPVSFMALDPRLAPGGLAELRETVAALRQAGIGVILDLVFNHTGESDELGTTLSLRGLDNRAYFRHAADHRLVNDTGTGNTLACDRPVVRRLVLDSLRHFVLHAGVDGFRFDLATVLGRGERGFDPSAALLREMAADPVLADRVLIAEPWDIGPGGYQLGNFPPPFLEWNDRYRDGVRRFWRGDAGAAGALATRLAGSSDIFGRDGAARTRSVNFIAAHDGMTLADLTSYERKHNEANGEHNRDGHDDNVSWNHGVEGPTDNRAVLAARRRDRMALLATLFASRGAILLTAGDEFGRTQRGNNNAYAQDNDITWLDWERRDFELAEFAARLSRLRSAVSALRSVDLLAGAGDLPDVEWLAPSGEPMCPGDWNDSELRGFAMLLRDAGGRIAVLFNRGDEPLLFLLPAGSGRVWRNRLDPESESAVPPHSVAFLEDCVSGN